MSVTHKLQIQASATALLAGTMVRNEQKPEEKSLSRAASAEADFFELQYQGLHGD